ncbi:succinoglycan biosynthesis protein [Sinorhizobium americanum CCGM7]|uniref:thermonuclease family protein n=1 Tax=Sinorhizobium americanum TaxID=194963 RepID=UPI0004D64615|nr:thermonuclease family protein [Sinorhizobium americanum]APG83309.1 succinoglycan biosynthesis protein [Sinorhizobium americanum CCGM7]
MRPQFISIAGGLAALALYIGILFGGAASIRGRESAATPDLVLETPDVAMIEEPAAEPVPAEQPPAAPAQPNAEEEAAAKTSRTPVRPVDPNLFTMPEEGLAKPLERIAPRPPLSAPPEKKATPLVLQRPVALAAGLVQTGETTLQIRDIEPEKADRICEGGGKSWPCGMVARTAFRNFLRGRALVCAEVDEKREGSTAASCTVGNMNVAEWLVTNGWAMPLPGTALEAKAEAARNAKRGFYGSDPRDLSRRRRLVIEEPAGTADFGGTAPDLQAPAGIPNWAPSISGE